MTGSIAAYKAVEIASALTKRNAIVNSVLTPAAEKFISALTFESVTGKPAFTDNSLWNGQNHVPHIELGHNADLVLIAPASADTIARLAHGFGDNLLVLTVLASSCPILLAPAMDADMYHNPITQENIEILKKRGYGFIGPESGHLASGLEGLGRMSEPADIVSQIELFLSRSGPLQGKHVVITAGGTQEPIDPVRMITNRSSGKQGYAVAQAALDAGADVTLISAPTSLTAPCGSKTINVRTAAEMKNAVLDQVKKADCLIMCAAVADFRPKIVSDQKMKKRDGFTSIEIENTEDILLNVGKSRENYPELKMIIGFAAESQNLIDNAIEKLSKKNIDMIVANDISSSVSGFGSDQNQAVFLFRDGTQKQVSLTDKYILAEKIINEVINHLTKE